MVAIFDPQFREDLIWWARTKPATFNRILIRVEATLDDPFSGIGKPEPLKYLDSNVWSRRVTQEHRLVYKVSGNRIYFLQARFHY
ncbi:MAG: Txe/YoeB family addiction module toxin [Cyanobacteria bacterium P01_F01_bin.150]